LTYAAAATDLCGRACRPVDPRTRAERAVAGGDRLSMAMTRDQSSLRLALTPGEAAVALGCSRDFL
jgi:hypothetical protein